MVKKPILLIKSRINMWYLYKESYSISVQELTQRKSEGAQRCKEVLKNINSVELCASSVELCVT